MKRSLVIILGIVLALAVLGGGIYLRSRSNNTAAPGPESGGSPGLPEAGTHGGGTSGSNPESGGGLGSGSKSLNLSDVAAFTVTTSSEIIAVKADGEIIRASSSSAIISNQKISGLLWASFSWNGRKILVKSGDALSPRWSVYDIAKNSWRLLQIDTQDAAWAPGDYRIAFVARKPSGVAVSIMDLGNERSAAKGLFSMNAEDLEVSWPSPQKLFLGEKPSSAVESSAWIYDLKKSALTQFRNGARGFTVAWDGQGNGIAFEGGSLGRGGVLSMVNEAGGETERFSFLTLPRKCVLYTDISSSTAAGSRSLACATPRDSRSFRSASLPDDYLMRAIYTADDFYAINLRDGTFTTLKNDDARQFDAEQLLVQNGNLYFINRLDNKLYSLSL